eukprot:Blabericola_migrator_1__12953@NODE_857_length_6241_cov_107_054746_g607_i0_p3_GENE_NODE_857_length_6241_cov_107_054746_g607_i0NODE_857_length_6241_cov_107_054746_g607_i0_p3_ORF_typecomplete_len228_score10_27_NODE_857_length_6241_cov_107_054746_g607_i045815264
MRFSVGAVFAFGASARTVSVIGDVTDACPINCSPIDSTFVGSEWETCYAEIQANYYINCSFQAQVEYTSNEVDFCLDRLNDDYIIVINGTEILKDFPLGGTWTEFMKLGIEFSTNPTACAEYGGPLSYAPSQACGTDASLMTTILGNPQDTNPLTVAPIGFMSGLPPTLLEFGIVLSLVDQCGYIESITWSSFAYTFNVTSTPSAVADDATALRTAGFALIALALNA